MVRGELAGLLDADDAFVVRNDRQQS